MTNDPHVAGPMLPLGTFEGKVVAITGGGTGLGFAMASAFTELGASIAVLSRSADNREKGVQKLLAAGATAQGFEVDVRHADQIERAFGEIEVSLGHVDVLINNAAGLFMSPAEDISPNGFRAVMQIDAEGTFFCSREFARRSIARGASGAILNIGAYVTWAGGPGIVHAASAKAAVHAMTKTLAVEWAPHGIRVNALVPGLFPHEDLPIALAAAYTNPRSQRTVPMQRFGETREIGWAATYLCSPFASYVTGDIMVIDGAYSINRWIGQPEYVTVRDQMVP